MGYSEIVGRDPRLVFIGGGAWIVRQACKQALDVCDIQVEELPYPHTRLGRWAEDQSHLRAWTLCDWNKMDKGRVIWVYDASPSQRGEELEAIRRLRVMHHLRNGNPNTIRIAITILEKEQTKLVESWGFQALPLDLVGIIRFASQEVDPPYDHNITPICIDEFKASIATLTHSLKNPDMWDEHRTGLITLFRLLESDCECLKVDDGKALCRDSIDYWASGSNRGQADLRRRWGNFHSLCIEANKRCQ